MKKYYLVPEGEGIYSSKYLIPKGEHGMGSFDLNTNLRNSYGSKEVALAAIKKAKEDDRKAEESLLFKKNNPPILIE